MNERISLRQSNKGFTLVEICVVLLLISILAAITTLSLISWQEYSTNKKQEDNAEIIYMAFKNKISQLKSDNTLYELKNWGSKGTSNVAGVTYPNKYHTLDNTSTSDTIYYMICEKTDYEKYKKKTLGDANKILMFDLLVDYIHDKKMLKANIAVEYGEDGTIYSVYYSDRTTFGYGASYGLNLSSKLETTSDKLYNKVVGVYYSQ